MKRLFLSFLLFLSVLCNAQGYADNWVIANGLGINFSSGSPIVFTANVHHNLFSTSNSSLSCISDKSGNLLFYQTQDSIMTSTHGMMNNGHGLHSSYGVYNSYTSCIIPSLVNDSLCYVFYITGYLKSGGVPENGLFYSLVNTKLNNGLGEVLLKNIAVLPVGANPGYIAPMYNEKKHRYEIHFRTSGGSNISNPGARMAILDSTGVYLNPPNVPAYKHSGVLCRWNIQADCLACYGSTDGTLKTGFLQLWDYNKALSTFSLRYGFQVSDVKQMGDFTFSPSGRYVFISSFDANYSRIWRFDIYLPDTISIKAQVLNVQQSSFPNTFNSVVARMQLAPDQKIYCTVLPTNLSSSHPYTIGVINHPDSNYASNFNANAVNNLGNKTRFLPNFVLNWIARPPFSLRHACQDSVVFDLTYKNIVDSVYWDFGDPASGALNFSNLLSPVHHYTGYGRYYVQVVTCWQGDCDTLADTVRVEPVPTVTLPNDTLLCPGASLTINIGQGFAANYLWSNGSTDSLVTLNQSGTYMATSYTACGASTDTITIKVIEPPTQQLRDTTVCDNFRVVLHFSADSATYLWSTGDTSATLYPTASGQYSVQVQNPCGSITDQAEVTYKRCLCNVYVPNAFTPDGDGMNDFFGPVADCPDFRFTMYIYNRWGGQVAVLTESNPEWDGTYQGEPVPMGVYTYRFEYKGTEYNLTKQEWLNGVVSVLR